MLVPNNAPLYADLFEKLNAYQYSYAYSGDFNEELTARILSLIESSMAAGNETSKTRKKVYFIMVESLQNITRHQAGPKNKKLLDGFFSIHKFDEGYIITSGNVVENKNIDLIKQKLERVNSLDADQLKEYYYEVLNLGGFSDKGGAGLGLIEMVRKSGNKLAYEFVQLDEEFAYFYFQANIAMNVPEGSIGSESVIEKEKLMLVRSIHKTVLEGKLKTIFYGHFGHESLKNLLALTENGITNTDNVALRKSIISVMIELLQNICYHGSTTDNISIDNPGLFMVSDEESSYSLITVNYIESTKTEALGVAINKINNFSNEQLNNLFLKIIKIENKDGKIGAGLGLIDIRLKTQNKVELEIVPATGQLSYLIIKAKINF